MSAPESFFFSFFVFPMVIHLPAGSSGIILSKRLYREITE